MNEYSNHLPEGTASRSGTCSPTSGRATSRSPSRPTTATAFGASRTARSSRSSSRATGCATTPSSGFGSQAKSRPRRKNWRAVLRWSSAPASSDQASLAPKEAFQGVLRNPVPLPQGEVEVGLGIAVGVMVARRAAVAGPPPGGLVAWSKAASKCSGHSCTRLGSSSRVSARICSSTDQAKPNQSPANSMASVAARGCRGRPSPGVEALADGGVELGAHVLGGGGQGGDRLEGNVVLAGLDHDVGALQAHLAVLDPEERRAESAQAEPQAHLPGIHASGRDDVRRQPVQGDSRLGPVAGQLGQRARLRSTGRRRMRRGRGRRRPSRDLAHGGGRDDRGAGRRVADGDGVAGQIGGVAVVVRRRRLEHQASVPRELSLGLGAFRATGGMRPTAPPRPRTRRTR